MGALAGVGLSVVCHRQFLLLGRWMGFLLIFIEKWIKPKHVKYYLNSKTISVFISLNMFCIPIIEQLTYFSWTQRRQSIGWRWGGWEEGDKDLIHQLWIFGSWFENPQWPKGSVAIFHLHSLLTHSFGVWGQGRGLPLRCQLSLGLLHWVWSFVCALITDSKHDWY